MGRTRPAGVLKVLFEEGNPAASASSIMRVQATKEFSGNETGAERTTLASFEQPPKQHFSTLRKLAGKVTFVRASHATNVLTPIVSTRAGRTRLVSALHCAKAWFLSTLRESGRITCRKKPQEWNNLSPRVVKLKQPDRSTWMRESRFPSGPIEPSWDKLREPKHVREVS